MQALQLPFFPDGIIQLPYSDMGRQLFGDLGIAGALSGNVPEEQTGIVLESIGHDILVFLLASVVVTPVANQLGVTSILGYLIAGALLGPHGFDVFNNVKADVELGDFGILFLLFSEGLEVSKSRLQKLANYLPLGVAQISLTAGVLTAAIMGAPEYLERLIPLDAGLINIHNPIEALVLALAAALSTSAFIFPVLKEMEWEDEEAGQAATSILLLQDLFVAPLLVLLPFVVGQGETDYSAIAFLTAKATLGFGSVVFVGSYVLTKIFNLVAQARSTETFVALCLLVSVGMGAIAKSLGLTDTAGAFAAGVLLANTNYRAQVQADIVPFKGILLGIFFMEAGSNFDLDLVLAEWATILTGSLCLVAIKAATLFAATRIPENFEPNRLPYKDAVRLSLLLSGGGEFAFVVLALAERLDVLPKDLGSLLTAIILITMGLTPLLGQLARKITEELEEPQSVELSEKTNADSVQPQVRSDSIVVCGYGEVGYSLINVLANEYIADSSFDGDFGPPHIVAFDSNPSLVDKAIAPTKNTIVLFGDATNPEVIRLSGITSPAAIFITYADHPKVLSATSRLRLMFKDVPIYVRASARNEAITLKAAGANEVIVEADELPRSAISLLRNEYSPAGDILTTLSRSSPEEVRQAAALLSSLSLTELDRVLELFECIDQDSNSMVDAEELTFYLKKTNTGIASDSEAEVIERYVALAVRYPLKCFDFVRLYSRSPEKIKQRLADACLRVI